MTGGKGQGFRLSGPQGHWAPWYEYFRFLSTDFHFYCQLIWNNLSTQQCKPQYTQLPHAFTCRPPRKPPCTHPCTTPCTHKCLIWFRKATIPFFINMNTTCSARKFTLRQLVFFDKAPEKQGVVVSTLKSVISSIISTF